MPPQPRLRSHVIVAPLASADFLHVRAYSANMGEAAWEQDFESLLDSPAAMHETLTGPNALRDLEALEAAKLRQGKASTSAAGRKGRVSGR